MAHGIQEFDKGVVMGDTWHKMPQYIRQETPVTSLQATEVLNYPMKKIPLYANLNGEHVNSGCHAIVRTDHNEILATGMGNRFTVIPNVEIHRFISENAQAVFPDLEIESVGTLFNGATAFVNFKVDEYTIKGDSSPTLSRLMWYNPIGKGGYQVCAHNIRVVCNNTLTAATNSAKHVRKASHTPGAMQKINGFVEELAEYAVGLNRMKEGLNHLAGQNINDTIVKQFVEGFYSIPDKATQSLITRVNKNRDEFYKAFETNNDLKSSKYTKYGMLQAVTYIFDHEESRSNTDSASIAWDGIVGTRSNKKQAAYNMLMNA